MKLFTKFIIFSFTASLLFASNNNGIVIGNSEGNSIKDAGKVVTKICKIDNFSKIDFDSIADLDIRVGKTTSCEIKGDKNIIPLILFKNSGDKLVIRNSKSFSTNSQLKIRLTTPSLKSIKSDSSADINVVGLNEESLKIKLDGSVTLKASGKVTNLEVILKGSSEANLNKTEATNAEVTTEDSSELNLFVINSLIAKAKDSSEITYKGSPKSVKKSAKDAYDIDSDD